MRKKVFGVLQRIGRSFMLPIAVLPIAGMFLDCFTWYGKYFGIWNNFKSNINVINGCWTNYF